MSSPAEYGRVDLHLKRLQRTCEVTLERFTATATDSCHTAARLKRLPVSKDKRLEIYLLKKKEEQALAAYQKARNELLGILEADPELVNCEAPQAEVRQSGGGQPRVGLHRRTAG